MRQRDKQVERYSLQFEFSLQMQKELQKGESYETFPEQRAKPVTLGQSD